MFLRVHMAYVASLGIKIVLVHHVVRKTHSPHGTIAIPELLPDSGAFCSLL